MTSLPPIFPQRRAEQEIEEELDFHIAARVRELMAEGMSPAAARDEALRRFGDLRHVRRQCRRIAVERLRAQRRAEVLDGIKQDIRYSLRMLRRHPGFTVVAVAVLALGIGGGTAAFSVVDAVLLRPLPFQDPERLVLLWGAEGGLKTGSNWASYPDYLDFEAQQTAFEGMAAWSHAQKAVTAPDARPSRLATARVSHDLFPLLGVQPALGRGILRDDDRPDAEPVVVLSHGFWAGRFASDPKAVGATLRLDGVPHTVVGVMPPGFDFPDVDLWVAMAHEHATDQRGQHRLLVLARLRQGVSFQSADSEVQAIAARLEAMYPETNTERGAYLEPLHEAVVGDVRPALLMLLGAVGVVLLIACANVANLLLARGTTREREVAVRTAMGAGRSRLVRQLLTESVVLALLGGALGVAVAVGALELLRALGPGDIPRLDEVSVDGRVLGFSLAITSLTGILFGLVPALQASTPDLGAALKEGGRTTASSRRARARKALVVAEMALAVVLVAGAGLFINSLLRLQRVDPGFTARDVLVLSVSLPSSRYPMEEWSKATAFYTTLIDRVEALPGVRSAATAYQHPLAGSWETSFSIPGVYERPRGQRPEARVRPVSPEYFETVGIPLLRGRRFTADDRDDAPGVVIINESFTRAFFPNQSPLGYRLEAMGWWPFQSGEWEIVGVVGDVKMDGLQASTPWAMYFPYAQAPFNDQYLFVGTAADPLDLAAAVRAEVWSLDSELPLEDVRTLEAIRHEETASQRFQTWLLGAFAGLALLLAAVGIYGVLSYTVMQRTGEIGVRLSLGAETGDVFRLVVGQGMKLTLLGLGIGTLGAFAAARVIGSLLFDVSPGDPVTFAAVTALLTLVALAASMLPALRAARVDPVTALRAE